MAAKKEVKVLRKSKKWDDLTPRIMAYLKLIRDKAKKAEAPVKKYILDNLERFPAVTQKGGYKIDADVRGDSGTLSYRKPSRKPGTGLKIVNALAFMAWCEENGIEHNAQPTVTFPEEFVTQENLAKLVEQAGGVMPDGMDDDTTFNAATLTVRMSEEQAKHLVDDKLTVRQLLEMLELKEDLA
jgi:hypothetical protein